MNLLDVTSAEQMLAYTKWLHAQMLSGLDEAKSAKNPNRQTALVSVEVHLKLKKARNLAIEQGWYVRDVPSPLHDQFIETFKHLVNVGFGLSPSPTGTSVQDS